MEARTGQTEATEPKKFLSRGEIIEAIKDLDESIVQVSLNLIKCDFKATQEDVRRAFPDFQFVKVKNYSAGSFEVVLPLKIDAINFVKNSRDVFILSRKPIIKMGRNYVPSENEDWVFVGGTARGHGGQRRHQNRDGNDARHKQHGEHHEPRQHQRRADQPRQKHVRTEEQRPEQPSTNTKVETKPQEPRQIETKVPEQKPKAEERKKEETKTNNQKPPAAKIQEHVDYKPFGFGRNLGDGQKLTPALKVEEPKKEDKKEQPNKKPQQPKKQAQKKETKKPDQEKAKQPEPQKTVEPPKAEDDGWITVTDNKRRKR